MVTPNVVDIIITNTIGIGGGGLWVIGVIVNKIVEILGVLVSAPSALMQ